MTLRRSSWQEPGWTRRRAGRGFAYLDQNGDRLSKDDVQRVRDLVIPPAWSQVWIAPDPDSHLQAVGADAAGRRQYLYHPRWREERDQQKFARAQLLGEALGRGRVLVARHLELSSRTREWACATAFRLLDLGCFRVGNDVYADEYGSFGLTTLQRRHVRRRGCVMCFDFPGKSGVQHHVEVGEQAVVAALERMRRRRDASECLLAYHDGTAWQELNAELVNEYIGQTTGIDATAKDFRTWHATVSAACSLATSGACEGEAEQQSAVSAAMEDAADLLGNTPTQARTSYVDPRVITAFRRGRTVRPALARRAWSDRTRNYRPLELAVLKLLRATDS